MLLLSQRTFFLRRLKQQFCSPNTVKEQCRSILQVLVVVMELMFLGQDEKQIH